MRQIYKSPMTFANIFTKVVGLLLFWGVFGEGRLFPQYFGGSHPRLLYNVLSGLSFRRIVLLVIASQAPKGRNKKGGCVTPRKINVMLENHVGKPSYEPFHSEKCC